MADGSHPFWADDFDLDLLKVVPEVAELLGPLSDRVLWTHGTVSKEGRLAHPSCWNGGPGFIAFFGSAPDRAAPPTCYVTTEPLVECTLLEAVRDAWVHSYAILLDRKRFWGGTPDLQAHFQTLLWHTRAWGNHGDPLAARNQVYASLDLARLALEPA